MAPDYFRASAPGSLLLLGEHLILRGYPAVSLALSERIQVSLFPKEGRDFLIEAKGVATLAGCLDALPSSTALRFVIEAIRTQVPFLRSGFYLEICADFPSHLGLGSSAAVTLATLAVLRCFAGLSVASWFLFAEAYRVIQVVQGQGSGMDVLASLWGGVNAWDPSTLERKSFDPTPLEGKLHRLYVGYKTPTPEVIRRVRAAEEEHSEGYRALWISWEKGLREGMAALAASDLTRLGAIFQAHRVWHEALGIVDTATGDLLSRLNACPGILGAKISGSGLGDNLIALGDLSSEMKEKSDWGWPGAHLSSLHIDRKGLYVTSSRF